MHNTIHRKPATKPTCRDAAIQILGAPSTAKDQVSIFSTGIADVLLHDIKWSIRSNKIVNELDEATEEHIASMIQEGFREGQLCVYDHESEETFYGYWSIRRYA